MFENCFDKRLGSTAIETNHKEFDGRTEQNDESNCFLMKLFFLLKLRKTLYITMYKLFYNLRIFRFKWNYDIDIIEDLQHIGILYKVEVKDYNLKEE